MKQPGSTTMNVEWHEAEPLVDEQVSQERERAHAKHGETSMRHSHPLAERRFRILVEEVGEIAEAFNDRDHGKFADEFEFVEHLFEELIQVAAMASDWAIALATLADVELQAQ